jgi:outer membrane protein
MKNLVKVALVAICILSLGSFANAQQKIGYVNADAIMGALPESKTVQTQIQAVQKQYTDQFTALQSEFNKKAGDFQKNQATMNDAAKTAAQGELADLQKRAQEFQQTAEQNISTKAQEYMKPLTEKVRTAIQGVAKEKGYTYVFNTANTDLLVFPEADNLEAAVKLKLAIK